MSSMKAWCHGGMETWHGMVASTLMSCHQQLVAHPTSVSRHQFGLSILLYYWLAPMKPLSVAVVVTQCTWEQLVCWWCWWGGRVYFRGPRTPPSRFSCPASVNCLLNTILESHAFFHHPALYCFIKSQPQALRHTFLKSFLFSSLITANSELPGIKQIWFQIMKDWNCSPSLASGAAI